MRYHAWWIRGAALAALALLATFGSRDRVLAFADSETVLFGPIGIARHEAVRVNVSAVGNPNDAPWDFVVRIFNRDGELVDETRLQLAPGVTGSVDVNVGNPDEFPTETLRRRTLRVEVVGFNPQPDPPGHYLATLEVFSRRTGATSVLLGGPDTVPSGSR